MDRSGAGRSHRACLVLTFSLAACATTSSESLEHDVQEAVLRWAFENAETDLDPPAVHCVTMFRGMMDEVNDPEPQLLARFSDDPVPVKPQSACQYVQDAHHMVIDKATGEFGLLFIVHPIEQLDDDHARAWIEYLQGGTWGVEWRCNVRRKA